MSTSTDFNHEIPMELTQRELCQALWPNGRSPHKNIRCRFCGQANRVDVERAVMEPERHSCGVCRSPLFLFRTDPLVGLSSVAYQHSLDRRSIAALSSIPGAANALRRALRHVVDRPAYMMFMAESIRCEEAQFPELIALLDKARKSLDISYRPTLFLGESPHMNALTTGVEARVIVVQSALLDQMSDREMVAIFGHELGHLQTDHIVYQSAARLLLQGAAGASHVVRMLSMPLWRLILHWSRCAELTADRAALLASRDLGACISMMLNFAGGNRSGTTSRTRIRLAPFIQQCRELVRAERNQSTEALLGGYLRLNRTHPHVAWRVMHLIEWVEHGRYLNILSGDYAPRPRGRARRPLLSPVVTRVEQPRAREQEPR